MPALPPPLLKRPASAPYFHSLFLIFQIPPSPLSEVIKIHFPPLKKRNGGSKLWIKSRGRECKGVRIPCKGRVKPEAPKRGTQKLILVIFYIPDLLETAIKIITKIGLCIDTGNMVFASMAVVVVIGGG